jgi:hypothetical protein
VRGGSFDPEKKSNTRARLLKAKFPIIKKRQGAHVRTLLLKVFPGLLNFNQFAKQHLVFPASPPPPFSP